MRFMDMIWDVNSVCSSQNYNKRRCHTQQPNFRGSIKAQSKDKANREHMPRLRNATKESWTTPHAESHDLLMAVATFCSSPNFPQLLRCVQIQKPDDQQKGAWNAASYDIAKSVPGLQVVVHEMLCRNDSTASKENYRRMTQREKHANLVQAINHTLTAKESRIANRMSYLLYSPWINKMNIRAPPKTVIYIYICIQLESLRSQPEWCMCCMKTFQNSRQSVIFKSWNRGDV